MPSPPLVSIALCTYQGARFLPAQLESLRSQDYPNLEIVAVDDASTDATFDVLREHAARDPRIQIHRNPANLGFRANFAAALGRCRGELIAPCDQDDVWRADKLRVLWERLGDGAGVYSDSELVDEAGAPLGRRFSAALPMRMQPFTDPASFLFLNCVAGHALLVRRAVVEAALPIPGALFHDWWLAFVAAGAGGLRFCPEPLVRYRVHRSSVTDVASFGRRPEGPRPRGYALARHTAVEERLRAFAAFPGPERDFFARLLDLWEGWRGQLLSPRLAAFLVRHRRRLWPLRRRPGLRGTQRALGYLLGLRARQVARPHAYGAADPPS